MFGSICENNDVLLEESFPGAAIRIRPEKARMRPPHIFFSPAHSFRRRETVGGDSRCIRPGFARSLMNKTAGDVRLPVSVLTSERALPSFFRFASFYFSFRSLFFFFFSSFRPSANEHSALRARIIKATGCGLFLIPSRPAGFIPTTAI